ncbi:methylenetetrahydrofolate reductase [NAD(P)H] [Anaerophilus nitritogenes]|uniref:methylenetetrahydrofolate reductase [NAD(P)H] n=1 Tax=Anaerophilus nitritogenes TaxID=2498136 RepID=UPI00101DC9C5|nr:methylenetetrahydrofolate reductase [NAD(P)H] [Anaerophilus nitritogenes]
MYIKDIFTKKKPVISFEIFPPKPSASIQTIYNTIDALAPLRPDYISVTYGAGGSTSKKTVEIASMIKNTYDIEALAHLTGITYNKKEIDHILKELNENNIENVLALRGDLPQDPEFKLSEELDFKYASHLVKHIKLNQKFCIGGACYPEGHMDTTKEEDLSNLCKKVDAGVDFLITQLFLDNHFFYEFKEKTIKRNINIPIQAGIMPVINKNQIRRIISLCGAYIPKKFLKIIDKYENNPEALKDAGIAYATDQIIDLLSSGVDGIHIYTMNNPEVAKRIVSNTSSIVYALNKKHAV